MEKKLIKNILIMLFVVAFAIAVMVNYHPEFNAITGSAIDDEDKYLDREDFENDDYTALDVVYWAVVDDNNEILQHYTMTLRPSGYYRVEGQQSRVRWGENAEHSLGTPRLSFDGNLDGEWADTIPELISGQGEEATSINEVFVGGTGTYLESEVCYDWLGCFTQTVTTRDTPSALWPVEGQMEQWVFDRLESGEIVVRCTSGDGCHMAGIPYDDGAVISEEEFKEKLVEFGTAEEKNIWSSVHRNLHWKDLKDMNRGEWAARLANTLLPDAGDYVLGELIDEWLNLDANFDPWENVGEHTAWGRFTQFVMMDYSDAFCEGLDDWKASEYFIRDSAGHYTGMYGLPSINSIITVQGKRTDFTQPFDCDECHTSCSFNGEKPYWFRKTEDGNIEAAGFVYEVSWTVSHPYNENTDAPGLESNGSIKYRIKMVGQPCTSEGLQAIEYFNVSLEGDEELRTLEPGRQHTYYHAIYDKGYYDTICIEFISWEYDGHHRQFPADCVPSEAGNGAIITKKLEWPGDFAVIPSE